MSALVRRTTIAMCLTVSVFAVPSAASADAIGSSACSAEVWARDPAAWQEYPASTTLGALFAIPADQPDLAAMTLADAVDGTAAEGAERLLRAAAVAYLNASDERVAYPYRRFGQPFHIEATVDAALIDTDPAAMRRVTRQLEAANRLPCPITENDTGGFGENGPQVAAPAAGRLPGTGPSMPLALMAAAAMIAVAFGIALRAVRPPR